MSLDYWRNKEHTAYLSLASKEGEYYLQVMEDLTSGDAQIANLDREDLENLQRSINLLLQP